MHEKNILKIRIKIFLNFNKIKILFLRFRECELQLHYNFLKYIFYTFLPKYFSEI